MNAFVRTSAGRILAAATLCLAAAIPAAAATDVTPRITQRIDDSQRVTLKNNTPSLAKPKYDKGAVNPGTAADRIQLVLKRSAEQENELKQLIASQHTPGTANFHKWLTPDEFGKRFGLATSDVQAITAWLQAKGFNVAGVNKGGTTLEFSGTAGQLKAAFGTEIHTYNYKGTTFHSNNQDPSIPAALSKVVAGFASLNDIQPKSDLKVLGQARFNPKTHKATPMWNIPFCDQSQNPDEVCNFYAPTPADLAVQYNLTSTYSGGTNGAGYNIGIISASNVDTSNFNNYRSTFGLPATTPQVVVDGYDPGQNGAATEAYLDVEASGAMAPGANVLLYVGGDTITTSGFTLAIIRSINDDIADTLSLSYGTCEQQLGASGNQFFYYAWQQAAAQGQSVFVSAGDGGSAGCDDFDTASAAQYGLAVSGFASTPYDTAVGGTDFYYQSYAQGYFSDAGQAELASYWGTTTSDTPNASLIKQIPEQPWNDSLGLNWADINYFGNNIVAGSGGQSSCVLGSGDDGEGGYTACSAGYPKPSWQSAPGVPADSVRDIPDVSLFAANGAQLSAWPICAEAVSCTDFYYAGSNAQYVDLVGGTSASSPAMAGIMATIDSAMKGRQGLANFYLYPLATQYPTAFNDVTVGSNNVVCEPGSPNCSLDSSDSFYSLQEWPAGPGYDLASGLGTVNGANMIANWNKITFAGSTTTLSLDPTTAVHGTPITATASVTAATGTATGNVAIITDATLYGQKGQGTIALTDGTGSAAIPYMPGGTYNVSAVYSGDGTTGPSTSSGVTVTITPENSSTSILVQQLDVNFNYSSVSSGATIPYGGQLYFDANIGSTSGFGTATGTVSLTDSGKSIATTNVNSGNVAEAQISTLAPGTHSLVASYSGDASFNPSTSSAFALTIVQGTPQAYLEDNSSEVPLYAGQTFQVPVVVVGTSALGAAPTGSVTVTFGTAMQTATLTPTSLYSQSVGAATVTFTNIPAGAQQLTFTYTGDANYLGATAANPETVTVLPASTLLASTTTLTANGSTLGQNGALTLTAVVAGASATPVPTGSVVFQTNGIYLGQVTLDGTGTAQLLVYPGGYPIFSGSNELTAQYVGDTNYSPSISTPLDIAGNTGDFMITATSPSVVFTSSVNQILSTVTLQSTSGLSGTASLTCATSSPYILCTIPNASVALGGDGTQVSTQVKLVDVTLKGTTGTSANHNPFRKWMEGGSIAFAALFFCFPRRRRLAVKVLMLVLAAGLAGGAIGCAGSSNTVPNTGGTQVAPNGSYYVTITATLDGVQHSVVSQVTVQGGAQN